MQVKWQTFEKPENKRQMYGSGSTQAWLPYICLLFSGFSNVYHFACVWPTALKLGCITNFDVLFLVMGFISLVNEIQFMLISSCRRIGLWRVGDDTLHCSKFHKKQPSFCVVVRLLLTCVDTNLAGTWYMYLLVLSQSKVNCSLMAKEMLGWFWWNCAQEYFLPHLCCGNKATGIISLEMLILVLGYWSRCGFPVLIFSHCGHSEKLQKSLKNIGISHRRPVHSPVVAWRGSWFAQVAIASLLFCWL